jgi:hypothetical protein
MLMQFLTSRECEEWLAGRGREAPTIENAKFSQRASLPNDAPALYFAARQIAAAVMAQRQPCLLWIQEWGIWSSSENLHLYYRLRESYGDRRMLEMAPGHLFLEHEIEDLTTFLHISLLHGWGGYLLSHLDYLNVFFSHDGYLVGFADGEGVVQDLLKSLES